MDEPFPIHSFKILNKRNGRSYETLTFTIAEIDNFEKAVHGAIDDYACETDTLPTHLVFGKREQVLMDATLMLLQMRSGSLARTFSSTKEYRFNDLPILKSKRDSMLEAVESES